MELTKYQQEERERFFINLIHPIIKDDRFECDLYITPPLSHSVYDGIASYYSKITKEDVKTEIYEIKVRDKSYTTLILEQKKYNDLVKFSKQFNNPIIKYICVCPDATYVYNLSELRDILKPKDFQIELHLVSTNDKGLGKKFKKVKNIQVSLAKKIDIKKDDYKIEVKKVEKRVSGFNL